MKRLIVAVATAFIFVGGCFAQDSGKKSNDTVAARGSIRHSTTNLKMDTVAPKEGAQVSIDYQWSLSTLLGEPILKCNAAWTLEGVYVRKKPKANVEWINAKDLPPKVAASVQIIDLDVNATSAYFKTSFDCDIGVAAAQGKERSWNFPTSPDWHEMFYALPSYSKEQAAKENKAKFKAMLGNADAVARLFEYQVKKIEFDVSGVRDWLLEQEQKANEKDEKQLVSAKAGDKANARKAQLDEAKTALAEARVGNQIDRSNAATTMDKKKDSTAAKEKRLEEKRKNLNQRNRIAGTWKRADTELIIEIPPIDQWDAEGGVAKIKVESKTWNGPARDRKIRNIRYVSGDKFSCEELWSYFLAGGKFREFGWGQCTLTIISDNEFSIFGISPFAEDKGKSITSILKRVAAQ
jgi:hypothetical protein